MKRLERPNEWSVLLNALAEESLTEEQDQRLADLLSVDVEFRREYVCYCQLITQLTWQLSTEPTSLKQEASTSSDLTTMPRNMWNRIKINPARASWISIAVTLIVIGVVWLGPGRIGDDSPGSVTEIAGQIGITHTDQQTIWIRAEDLVKKPWTLRPNDQVQTDRVSSAKLTLSDGTEIYLQSGTQLILTTEPDLILRLPLGSVIARVTPQPRGRALTFITPLAEFRVLGTELELLVLESRDEVGVVEGRVNVTRTSDGDSTEVSAAQFLSIEKSGKLTVVDWPQLAGEWKEDFEDGLPRGWTGRIARGDLPEDSHGALQAVSLSHPQGQSLGIASPIDQDGLFAWRDDSVMHLTFKVQPPGWLHLYLFARTCELSPSLLTYCCVKPDLWQSLPGQWRTVSIPLSEFRLMSFGEDIPTLGRIPSQVVFSGPTDSVGVIIDRVWVDRSNPPTGDRTNLEPRK